MRAFKMRPDRQVAVVERAKIDVAGLGRLHEKARTDREKRGNAQTRSRPDRQPCPATGAYGPSNRLRPVAGIDVGARHHNRRKVVEKGNAFQAEIEAEAPGIDRPWCIGHMHDRPIHAAGNGENGTARRRREIGTHFA